MSSHTTHPFLHPFAAPATPESEFIDIVGGEGATVRDAAGREYIDALASLWYCQIGHGRTEMRDAVSEQMTDLAAYSTFDPFTNATAARLAELVAGISPCRTVGCSSARQGRRRSTRC